MSALNNRHWIGFNGEPLTGRVPPELRVYGPELTGYQRGEVYHIYKLFTDACLLALGDYQVRNRVLSDGSRVRCTSIMGRDTVQVWTSARKSYDDLPHGIGLCLTYENDTLIPKFTRDVGGGPEPEPIIIVPGVRVSDGLPVSTGSWKTIAVDYLIGGQTVWANEDRTFWLSYSSRNPYPFDLYCHKHDEPGHVCTPEDDDLDRTFQMTLGPAEYIHPARLHNDKLVRPDWVPLDYHPFFGAAFGNREIVSFPETAMYTQGSFFAQGPTQVGYMYVNGGVSVPIVGYSATVVPPYTAEPPPSLGPIFYLEDNSLRFGSYKRSDWFGDLTEGRFIDTTVAPNGVDAVTRETRNETIYETDIWALLTQPNLTDRTFTHNTVYLKGTKSSPTATGAMFEIVETNTYTPTSVQMELQTGPSSTGVFTIGAGGDRTFRKTYSGSFEIHDTYEKYLDSFYDLKGNLTHCKTSLSYDVEVVRTGGISQDGTGVGQYGFPAVVQAHYTYTKDDTKVATISVERKLALGEKEIVLEAFTQTKRESITLEEYTHNTRSWFLGAQTAYTRAWRDTDIIEQEVQTSGFKKEVLYLDRFFDLVVYLYWEIDGSLIERTIYQGRKDYDEEPVLTPRYEEVIDNSDATVKLCVDLNGETVFSEDLSVEDAARKARFIDGVRYSSTVVSEEQTATEPVEYEMGYARQLAYNVQGWSNESYSLQGDSKNVETQPVAIPIEKIYDIVKSSTIYKRFDVQVARDPVTMAVAINVLWFDNVEAPKSWFWVVDQTGFQPLSEIVGLGDARIKPWAQYKLSSLVSI